MLNVQQDYFFSFNQSYRCFLVSSLPLPSSLVKLSIFAHTGSTCSMKVPYIELNMPMRAVNVNPMANIDFIFTCRRYKNVHRSDFSDGITQKKKACKVKLETHCRCSHVTTLSDQVARLLSHVTTLIQGICCSMWNH